LVIASQRVVGERWWLYSGSEDTVSSPLAGNRIEVYHTHPQGKPVPSSGDRKRLGQAMAKQTELFGKPLQTKSGLIPTVGPAEGRLYEYGVTPEEWENWNELYDEWVEWYNQDC